MKIRDKVIVIVGGSSGMGLATARLALEHGGTVHIVGSTQTKLDIAIAELQHLSGNVTAHIADIQDEAKLSNLFAKFEKIDHLVLSASGSKIYSEDIRTEDLEWLKAAFDTKVWGYIKAIKHASAKMYEGSSIVLFSGGFSVRPGANTPISTAANIAIEGLTTALAKSLSPIRVNAIRPGLINTPLVAGLVNSGQSASFTATLPIKRIGNAHEIAHGVLYLIENEYTTGTILTIDGGYLLR